MTSISSKGIHAEKNKGFNQRKRTLISLICIAVFLAGIAICGVILYPNATVTDFSRKNLSPGFPYLFGTDWLGRNMLSRTLSGLSTSILVGLLSASVSAVIAFLFGVIAATCGSKADSIITWIIDLIMGIPHIMLLILISFACGKGLKGVVIGVAITHWPSLARVIRAEVMQLKESQYIKIAGKLGVPRLTIVWKHMVPHLFPQFIVGLVLLFPHAVLHEASITFLGFGLPAEQPAIGIILSESMKYLITGKWWLALFPGILLVITVILFDKAGNSLRKILDPADIHI